MPYRLKKPRKATRPPRRKPTTIEFRIAPGDWRDISVDGVQYIDHIQTAHVLWVRVVREH
jgi:hypothetical protein